MSHRTKGNRILARSFFTRLRRGGCSAQEIVDVATELLELVSTELRSKKDEPLKKVDSSRGRER